MKALALLSTLQSADIILPTTDGRELRLRRVTEPNPEQKSSYTSSASAPRTVRTQPKRM